MSIRTRGSRKITVDGVTYRWRIRPRPPTDAGDSGGPLVFSAERADVKGKVLVAALPQGRHGTPGWDPTTPATPGQVAAAIRRALAVGWNPTQPGPPFVFDTVEAATHARCPACAHELSVTSMTCPACGHSP